LRQGLTATQEEGAGNQKWYFMFFVVERHYICLKSLFFVWRKDTIYNWNKQIYLKDKLVSIEKRQKIIGNLKLNE